MRLLIALVLVSNCHVGEEQILMRSPCPRVFRYEFPEGRARGVIAIAVTSPLPISLKVTVAVPAILTKRYDGRLEVADDRAEIARKARSGNLREIRYNLILSTSTPLPRLVSVQVNSKVVCSAPPLRRRIETRVTLEHSLSLGHVPKGGRLHPESILPNSARESCGTRLQASPLIVGGASVPAKGDWPWSVPLFRKTELGLEFACSSTLVSTRFVVTVAHCLKSRGAGLVAFPGRFSLGNWAESHSQPREISDVFLHPDYDSESLRSDLAVLRLAEPVVVSRYVNPACTWSWGDDDVVGETGTVSGWGVDGRGDHVADTPNIVDMPIVSQEECLRSKIEFVYLTSNTTLCAGSRDGPCNGDSGGGLLIQRRDAEGNFRWYLRGVVSLSVKHKSFNKCDLSQYVVFTDVAKYGAWLSDILNGIDVSALARIAKK